MGFFAPEFPHPFISLSPFPEIYHSCSLVRSVYAYLKSMTAYAFRISLECPHCRGGVPVNGFTHEVLCTGCLKSIPLPQAWWDTLLPMDKVEKALKGSPDLVNHSHFLSGMRESLDYGNRTCSCQGCQSPLGDPWIKKAAETEGGPCPGCKDFIRVRKASELVRSLIAEAEWVVHEGPTGSELEKELDRVAQPIIFGCLSCGAALPVDGSTRTPKCGHCSNENYLPDALWLRLHPAVVSHTFFVTRSENAVPVHITPDHITAETTEERAKRILSNRDTSPEVIRKMSSTFASNPRVLKLLAYHPRTPEDVMQFLCLPTQDEDVRHALATRTNLSHTVMDKLRISPERKIRAQLSRLPGFYAQSPALLKEAMHDLSFADLEQGFRLKEFPQWKILEMCTHCGEENAQLILSAPNTDLEVLKAMGHNPQLRPLIQKHPLYKALGPLRRAVFFW